jgi:hypothetical protein
MTQVDLGLTSVGRFDSTDPVISVNDANQKPGASHLGDHVVDPHEVGVFSKLGDDFACANPLGLPCYRGVRHEELLKSGVYSVGNLIQSLIEVPSRESLSEMPASFVPLSVAVTSSVLVVGGLVGRCIGGQLII